MWFKIILIFIGCLTIYNFNSNINKYEHENNSCSTYLKNELDINIYLTNLIPVYSFTLMVLWILKPNNLYFNNLNTILLVYTIAVFIDIFIN